MTNLENAGSIYKALETYLKPEGTDAFIAWCKAPCEQTIPVWLKAGKWFEIVETDEYYKIAEITGDLVHTTCGDTFPLYIITSSSNLTYSPITIKPWSFLEAEAVMRARTTLLIDNKTMKLSEVIARYEDEDNLIIVESNVDGTLYSTGYLADYGETDDHQPCGTIIPLYQKEN